MKVKELIAKLQKFKPDAVVLMDLEWTEADIGEVIQLGDEARGEVLLELKRRSKG